MNEIDKMIEEILKGRYHGLFCTIKNGKDCNCGHEKLRNQLKSLVEAVRMERPKRAKLLKCSFCIKKYRTDRGLEAHEIICYSNPNRVCAYCNNKREYDVDDGYGNPTTIECQYCKTHFEYMEAQEMVKNLEEDGFQF